MSAVQVCPGIFFCREIWPNFGAVIFVHPNQLHIQWCLLEIKFLWATPLSKAQTFSFNCDQHLYSRFLQKNPLFTKFTYQLRLLTGPYPNPLVSLIIYSFKYINKRSRSKHTGSQEETMTRKQLNTSLASTIYPE